MQREQVYQAWALAQPESLEQELWSLLWLMNSTSKMSVALAGITGRTSSFAVAELVGDEEAALATDAHALEGGVPALDDAVFAVGEGDGLATIDGGVELGAVLQVARVVNGVVITRLGDWASAHECIDVSQGVSAGA